MSPAAHRLKLLRLLEFRIGTASSESASAANHATTSRPVSEHWLLSLCWMLILIMQSVCLGLLLDVSLKDVLVLLLLKFALRRYTVLMRVLDFNRRCCYCKHGHLLNEFVVLDSRFELLVRESQVLDVVLLHHAHRDYFVVVLSQVLLRLIELLVLLEDSLQKLLKNLIT